jgi:tetratricopeptide (TPR) repeat protein
MKPATTKILLVAGALIFFVLLFIAPKRESAENAEQAEASTAPSTSAKLDVYLTTAQHNLSKEDKQQMDQLKVTDSLLGFWNRRKRPDLAAHYAEAKAVSSKKSADWFAAGNRYFYAVQFIQDQTEIPVLYQCAGRCFSKGLELEPSNTDARIMLASTYVESGADPMKGIGILKEIEKTDSNNVKLQLSFAFFSVKSGQLDKAIIRFKKALKADPTYLEAYLHIADAYEQLGNKEGTIENLEAYARLTPDVTAKLEVEKYIRQLKETK